MLHAGLLGTLSRRRRNARPAAYAGQHRAPACGQISCPWPSLDRCWPDSACGSARVRTRLGRTSWTRLWLCLHDAGRRDLDPRVRVQSADRFLWVGLPRNLRNTSAATARPLSVKRRTNCPSATGPMSRIAKPPTKRQGSRRFPPPWRVDQAIESFCIRDANGQALTDAPSGVWLHAARDRRHHRPRYPQRDRALHKGS
jgi:hypothetical protein